MVMCSIINPIEITPSLKEGCGDMIGNCPIRSVGNQCMSNTTPHSIQSYLNRVNLIQSSQVTLKSDEKFLPLLYQKKNGQDMTHTLRTED